MRRLAGTVAVLSALALAGTAAAYQPSNAEIQNSLRQTFNKRFAFLGLTARITRVRCQRETATSWFCLAHWNDRYFDSIDNYYYVNLNQATGVLNFKRQG